MLPRSILLSVFLLLGISACNSESRQDAPARVAPDNDAPQASAHVTQQDSPPQAAGTRTEDPELKKELLERLEAIRNSNETGMRGSEVQTLITELSSLTRVLAVTARVLDRNGVFAEAIRDELGRFEQGAKSQNDEAVRILNGMTGVYSMYAILAKMRFVGIEERQLEIQDIHDRTVAALRSESPVVETAAAIADACYELSSMIIRDIDSEGRYDKAFTQIELQYEQGLRVAKKREDVFINGMFRTYEISQLWLLSINPKATDVITQLNASVSEDSGSATNVGMQMGIAAGYLFLISYLIAQATVNIML